MRLLIFYIFLTVGGILCAPIYPIYTVLVAALILFDLVDVYIMYKKRQKIISSATKKAVEEYAKITSSKDFSEEKSQNALEELLKGVKQDLEKMADDFREEHKS